jgi:hypothetical protein
MVALNLSRLNHQTLAIVNTNQNPLLGLKQRLKVLNPKRNSYLKNVSILENLGILLVSSARSLATGHLSVLCGPKPKPSSN